MLLANCLLRHVFPENDYSIEHVTRNDSAKLKYLLVLKQ